MKFYLSDTVSVRLLCEQDAQELFSLIYQNRAHLRRWLTWVDGTNSVEEAKLYIGSIFAQLGAGCGFRCGVCFKGKLAHICGYKSNGVEELASI